MKILVTGSSGFVGTHLVPALMSRGVHVVGVDRRAPDRGNAPHEFIEADLCDPDSWKASLRGIDEVIHLAAAKADWGLSEAEYMRDNEQATRCLINEGVGAGIRRWLVFSTVGIYGPSADPLDEDGAHAPDSAYGRSKLAAEAVVRNAFDQHGSLDIAILRPSAIFGPGNPPEANVYRLIKAIQNHRFVFVGDGRTLKSTSYIGNVVAASMFLLDRSPQTRFDAYNYVDEPVLETRQLAEIIARHLGMTPRWPRVPLPLASAFGGVFDILGRLLRIDFPITSARIRKFCRNTTYSAARIRSIGFQPPCDIDCAVGLTVEWDRIRAAVRYPATSIGAAPTPANES